MLPSLLAFVTTETAEAWLCVRRTVAGTSCSSIGHSRLLGPSRFRRPRIASLVAIAWLLVGVLLDVRAIGQSADAFFENQVRPLLANRCYECHSAASGESKGSLRLDHGSWILQGGDSGAAVVAGKPEESLLYQAVNYQGYEMPPEGKLPEEEIRILKRWIEQGAVWPEEPLPEDRADQGAFDLSARRASHWVWQPLRSSKSNGQPSIESTSDAIDGWIRRRLTELGLEPNGPAEKRLQIRRVYLDLIGLPPTPEELKRWLATDDPEWFEALVDELLSSPQFGVRWARHWLDLVRFAQSRGHEFDEDIPCAEPYRDYVVRALNADVPYDQFVIEHIAGDLVESPRTHATLGWNESVLGTGFWHLGEWVHSPVDARKDETDRFDNMVDVFTKTFLGVTVACARCHDHKFDAISQQDYYALYGFLKSSDYRLVRYETDLEHRKAADALDALRAPIVTAADRALRDLAAGIAQAPDLTAEDLASPNGDAYRSVAKAIAADAQAEASRLPIGDARVHWDARAIEPWLWRSDSVIYGSGSQPLMGLSLGGAVDSPAWNVHRMTEGARDPFWNRMAQSAPGVNRQNRYTQIQEAGKILPTPKFQLESGKLSYLVRGSFRAFAAVDSHRLIAGPLHGEMLLDSDGPADGYRWVTQNLDRYRGKFLHLEFSPIGDKPFSIAQIIDGPAPAMAVPALSEDAAVLAVLKQARADLASWLGMASPGAVSPYTSEQRTRAAALLHAMVQPQGAVLPSGDGPWRSAHRRLQELASELSIKQRALADKTRWDSKLALAMRDGSGINDHLLIRGNPMRPGEEVPRRNLEALDGLNGYVDPRGSGRLELAEAWTDGQNPLVPRVMVNRLWHHLMGRGIAPTTDDLGVLGVPPTHPELLDDLAQRFVADGWSIKRMIRAICLSQTYRQDARASERAAEVDPNNEALSHARVRRLEAEAIRDTLLAVSGQIDLREPPENEPSVPVHLTEFLEGRGRPNRNGPLDGNRKRSLYLEVRRNFLNPMMTTFDTPSPFSTMGRRNVSNVPAQSLILLNDPLVHQLADRWAAEMVSRELDDRDRIRDMMLAALGREPDPQEMEMVLGFVRSTEFATPQDAYRSWAHMLFNSKELLFRF